MVKTTTTKALTAVPFLLAASLASAQHCRKIGAALVERYIPQ
jgi:hypothetical protein